MSNRQAGVAAATVLAAALAGGAAQAAPVSVAAGVPRAVPATQVILAKAAAARPCVWRKGVRHCRERVEASPYPNDYFYFAPNTLPTARRGWSLDSPVQHSPPSPR